jgi:hypothetical protein
MVTLAIGVVVSVAAYFRQREIEQREREAAEIETRIQTRAQEILADYEETGQGWFWETDRRGRSPICRARWPRFSGVRSKISLDGPFSSCSTWPIRPGKGAHAGFPSLGPRQLCRTGRARGDRHGRALVADQWPPDL